MKRLLCAILCLMLLCAATAQAKTYDYTIFEVMTRQLDTNSSYRVQVTGEVRGEAPDFADADLWELLKSLLPQYSLEGTYVLSKSEKTLHDMQTRLMVKEGDTTRGTLVLSGRNDRYVLSGDLLGEENVAFARGTDAIARMALPAQEGQWPSLWRVFAAMESAGSDWQQRFETAMAPYYAMMSEWVQDHTELKVRRNAQGQLCTQSTAVFTPETVRAQVINVLAQIYRDGDMMALLEEILADEEANVYLQDGMLPLYEEMLAAAGISGDVVITRSYDAEGALESETITLPFAAGSAVEKVSVSYGSTGYALSMQLGGGKTLDITMQGGGDFSRAYAGTFAYGTEEKKTSGSFVLTMEIGKEQYDEADAGRERKQTHTAMLFVKPDEGQAFPAQSLGVTVKLIGGDSNTNTVRCNVECVWNELGTDTEIIFNYKSRTAAALAQLEVDPDMAVQLGSVQYEEMAAYVMQTVQKIVENVSACFVPGAPAL